MTLTDQNLREKEFHDKLQSKSKGRFENIFYKAILNAWEDFYNFLDFNSFQKAIFGKKIRKFLDTNDFKLYNTIKTFLRIFK